MTQLVGQANFPAQDAAPTWVEDLRARGRSEYSGLPNRRTEEWRYTPVPDLEASLPDPEAINDATALPAAAVITMTDGILTGDPETPVEGVRVLTMSEALEQDAPGLRPLLESLELNGTRHAFSQLNTAHLAHGVYIHVAAEVDAGTIVTQWLGTTSAMNGSRVCVVLEEGAKLLLAEQFEQSGATRLNLVEQFSLAADAQLEQVSLQTLPEHALLLRRIETAQGQRSQYSFAGLDLGKGVARAEIRCALNDEEAASTIRAAVLAGSNAHVDYHLEADHAAPSCASEQFFRAVADDRAKVVFNGRVHVREGADGTEAQQSSAGLLMSKWAEINAKPELEIYADEVIAAHGATVGQLDPQAMFYLRSRGLGETEARRMLTLAFCRSVIEQVSDESLRDALGERFNRAMNRSKEHE